MAIAATFDYRPLLNWKGNLIKGTKLEFEFILSDIVTGDGSGGNITITHDFGDHAGGKNYYYLLTDISYFNSVTANHAMLTCESDDWKNFLPMNSGLTFILRHLTAVAALGSYEPGYQGQYIYLGKPKDGATNTGRITFTTTNTESDSVEVAIMGMAFTDPLPLFTINRLPFI